ncbi:spore germination protein [Paenibacillus bouchesdurhonensis]|uniref:spore germination protein n=1 Tax=Paenibacillus bouchesdurhonensis TaxID=1870990 RepID=UPI000DA60815|nr:spore germination protein [Paenibacillus bouchesdurhonensis]
MSAYSLRLLEELLSDNPDIVFKSFLIHGRTCTLIYIPTIIDNSTLQKNIAHLLHIESQSDSQWDDFRTRLEHGQAFPIAYQAVSNIKQASELIVQGKAVLYVQELATFYYFDIVQYQKRSITESQNELVVTGPQEAFIEDIQSNLSLLRHKLRHPKLKLKEYTIGDYSNTLVYVVYIDGLPKKEILNKIDKKLTSISIDGVFGISYLVEQFKDQPSLFPIFQYTERPDAVAASILEGRIGILMDGVPDAAIAPVTFFSLLQSSEDYYQNFYAASWIRIVRFTFSILSLLLPALYVAITTFHPQVLPANLLITISAARENIPFSALSEALIMELTFEALREAGTRIPKPVGQTVSIIGGIVIGQAAVQAGIVSAPMVIVVSITGVASYIIPHLELGLILRLLRFPFLILGGSMGLIGIFAGSFVIYAHLVSLKPFDAPYMQPIAPLVLSDWKDTFLRVSSPQMKKRSNAFSRIRNRRRDN